MKRTSFLKADTDENLTFKIYTSVIKKYLGMKTVALQIILFFVFVLTPFKTNAQQIITTMDSLLYTSNKVFDSGLLSFFRSKKWDITSEKEALSYLEKKTMELNPTIDNKVAYLLESLSHYGKSLELRQEALYHYVDMHFIFLVDLSGYSKEDFTKKTINRMVELIDKGISDKEIEILQARSLQSRINNISDKEIKLKQKELNCNREIALDSLKAHFKSIINKNEPKEYFRMHTKGPEKGIKILGWLYLKKYAPMLENLLKDVRYKDEESREAIILTLARMGYKNYFDQAITKYSHSCVYINIQEAYWRSIEMDNSLEIILSQPFGDGNVFTTKLTEQIDWIQDHIANFPKEYKIRVPFAEKKEDIPKLIEKTKIAYKWLEENKGHYEMIDDKITSF
jgi:hypothetical protein